MRKWGNGWDGLLIRDKRHAVYFLAKSPADVVVNWSLRCCDGSFITESAPFVLSPSCPIPCALCAAQLTTAT